MSTCLCPPQLREPTKQRLSDSGIARLGGVAALNIQRLVYRPSNVSWDAITSHPLFILRHPAAPPPIHLLQVARTLDDILAIVPTPPSSSSKRSSPANRAVSYTEYSGTADHAE